MKNSNLTLKLACWLIVAAIAVWLGLYAYNAANDPFRTVPVTAAESRDAVRVHGIVVRDEQVLYSMYNSARARLKEGERVAAGGIVAEAYDSEEALLGAARLAELRTEAEELTALLSLAEGENSQQADAEIQSGIRRLRASVAAGNLTEAESLSKTLQTRVFAAFRSADDIRARLQTVRTEIQQLSVKYEKGGTPIPAPISGLYSSTVDGWEDLRSEDLKELTPSALSALMSEKRQPPAWALGKLVSGVRWYLAAPVDAEDARRIADLSKVQVSFSRQAEALTMQLEGLGAEEGGKRVLILSCGEAMTDMLSLRFQDAELLISQASGLRIPRKALHVDEKGRSCVYVQTALQAEKKLVEVLMDFGDYYMVSSETLRAGDEVIVSAKNLYDGKVVS